MDPASIALQKQSMRRSMRGLRRRLASADPTADERAAQLLPLGFISRFGKVGGYNAQGSELSPNPLLRRLAAAGAKIALPAVIDPQAPLEFRECELPFERDYFGFPAPPPRARVLRPDLVIAPVLAFDRMGGRLGQGAGCFDRSLAELRRGGRLFVIGLAYAGQEVDRVPLEPFDELLDAILTETAYTEAQRVR
ncbi:MAG: 5-formyltetrahydrofolate cyclo-ligase [Caulobacteraceae bacterium]